jgi:drug/metabolite transporter (DMT)-like permease
VDLRTRRTLAWASLVTVYLVWGSTYLGIRVAVRDFPPLVLVGLRYLVAGLVLFPIALRIPARLQSGDAGPVRLGWRQWLGCAVVGGLLIVVGNGGVTVAEQRLPSGLAAVLVATVPLWIIGFAVPIRREPISLRAGLGVALGLVGVIVLAGGDTGGGDLGAVVTVLVAASGWGLGSVLAHVVPLPSRPLVASAVQMLVSGFVLVIVGALSGAYADVAWSDISAEAWWAFGWLVLAGSVIAFSAYAFALAELPLPVVSTYAYVNPVVAVLLGAVLLGERLSARELLGTVIVVASVAVVTMRRRRSGQSRSPASTEDETRLPTGASGHSQRGL